MALITVVLMFQRHKINTHQVETENWVSPQAYICGRILIAPVMQQQFQVVPIITRENSHSEQLTV